MALARTRASMDGRYGMADLVQEVQPESRAISVSFGTWTEQSLDTSLGWDPRKQKNINTNIYLMRAELPRESERMEVVR